MSYNRKCEVEGCEIEPRFKFPNERKCRRCLLHYEAGMIPYKKKYNLCQVCLDENRVVSKTATYRDCNGEKKYCAYHRPANFVVEKCLCVICNGDFLIRDFSKRRKILYCFEHTIEFQSLFNGGENNPITVE